ncbi:hypothetical protein L218DRAFT_240239 [Marasmius fiardii PR-910]|nr:hypothetical protein L218DRAFT_240239 [Marasmius fiardii PR-910]
MAQQQTFEVADGPSSILPSTNSPEVPRDPSRAFTTTPPEPIEIQADHTTPINFDNPFAPNANEHTYPAEIPQPTRQQLETMLQENNIIPFDHAHKHNNPPPPEAFDPYEALVDYEDCMRTWCKTFVDKDAEFNEEPMVSGDQLTDLSVDQILLLLPDTPLGLPWGVTPSSSVNYPVLVHHAQEMTSRHIRRMLETHPYIGGPPGFRPKDRDYPVPGKYLHRLLDLGWITDEEAKSRWLDIDWFSLRDYRVHLANKARIGNGSGEYAVVKKSRTVVFDGTLKTRERIWKDKKDAVEFRRLQMEGNVLMSEGRSEDEVVAFYEECGAGYVTQPPTDDSEKDRGTDGGFILEPQAEEELIAISETVSAEETPPVSSRDSLPLDYNDRHSSSDPPAFIGSNSVVTTSRSVNAIHEGNDCSVGLMQIPMDPSRPDHSMGMNVDSRTFQGLPVSHKRKVPDLVDVGADEERRSKPKRRKHTPSCSGTSSPNSGRTPFAIYSSSRC